MKVLLVEDQRLIMSALAILLDLEPDIEVVASASGGQQAQQLIAEHLPDIVISDIEMPDGDGLSLAEWLTASGLGCKMLILTTFAKPGYLQRALNAGVHGYLLKDTPAEQLAEKLRLMMQGAQVIDPSLTRSAMRFESPLSARELRLLALVATGLSAKQAADQLHIAHGTARNLLSEIMGKLQVSSRQAAVIRAQELGLL